MFQRPFSFEGRIRRTEYGITFIIYFFISIVYELIKLSKDPSMTLLALVVMIPAGWFHLAQGAKRCHDLGRSGWWQIIPLYFFWMLFQDGLPYENEWGGNPKHIEWYDPFAPQPIPVQEDFPVKGPVEFDGDNNH